MTLEVEILLKSFSVKITRIKYWTNKPKLAYASFTHVTASRSNTGANFAVSELEIYSDFLQVSYTSAGEIESTVVAQGPENKPSYSEMHLTVGYAWI